MKFSVFNMLVWILDRLPNSWINRFAHWLVVADSPEDLQRLHTNLTGELMRRYELPEDYAARWASELIHDCEAFSQ